MRIVETRTLVIAHPWAMFVLNALRLPFVADFKEGPPPSLQLFSLKLDAAAL
jgi:hypothetical protein